MNENHGLCVVQRVDCPLFLIVFCMRHCAKRFSFNASKPKTFADVISLRFLSFKGEISKVKNVKKKKKKNSQRGR